MYPEYLKFKTLPTPCGIEGPFYRSNAPFKNILANPYTLHLRGFVRSTDGQPIPDAIVDVWHADFDGLYDMEGYNFRGKIKVDGNGNFELFTIKPGGFLISNTEHRAPHIHFKIQAKGYRWLTTELFFVGDKPDYWFDKDRVLGDSFNVSYTFTLRKEGIQSVLE